MARPPRCRQVCSLPEKRIFIPEGGTDNPETVVLTVDEYEVLRLLDLAHLTQEQCALQMDVARTTVTGMYTEARTKVVDALVHGKRLVIRGGNFRLCGNAESCCHSCCGVTRSILKEDTIMKIAVTYEEGNVFQHFGHTRNFKIYTVEDKAVKESSVVPAEGAGHASLAQWLKDQDVSVLICGGIGGGAQAALNAAGIRWFGGVSGAADAAVEALLADRLQFNPEAGCAHHEGHGGHQCGGHGHAHAHAHGAQGGCGAHVHGHGHQCGGGHCGGRGR